MAWRRPGALPVAKYASENLIEVRGGHGGGRGGGGFHGGGGFRGGGGGGFRGGFHGGGMHGGGFAYRDGGYRVAHIYRGGGYRYSGLRYGGSRHAYHRPFVHRGFPSPLLRAYYYLSALLFVPRCRMIWTYYGPRKICHYRHWHRHHYWRHHHYWHTVTGIIASIDDAWKSRRPRNEPGAHAGA